MRMPPRTEPTELRPDGDTITAISTPAGEGGIGIIRLSGPLAIPITCRLFRRADGAALSHPEPFRQYYGHIVNPETGETVDEVLVSTMRGPRSYTREDMAEISAHGGPMPLRRILMLTCAAGARLARAGEYTERAFLNGRIDLTQAEAVLDIIRARTDAGLRAAQHVLQGELGRIVHTLRERLIALLASLEAAIDYADEDITFLTPAEIGAELRAIQQQLSALADSYTHGRLLREGAATAIVGRPNTGKSSLLNALLGEARAIVTEVPGTTRDVIEEQVDIGGVPLRLRDTAGIHESADTVERLGIARSRAALTDADLVLLVLDRSVPLQAEDVALLAQLRDRPVVLVLNKADLPAAWEETALGKPDAPIVPLSALTGEGLPQLHQVVTKLLLQDGGVTMESPMLANLRQREAVMQAMTALEGALATLGAGGTEELLAVDLMTAAATLGELTGDNIREQVIRELFARFCVGK